MPKPGTGGRTMKYPNRGGGRCAGVEATKSQTEDEFTVILQGEETLCLRMANNSTLKIYRSLTGDSL